MRKQVICPRIHPSLLEHLDDETWDVVDADDIESWVSQDLFKTCASFEPVSELDFCHDWGDRNRHGRCQRRVHTRIVLTADSCSLPAR